MSKRVAVNVQIYGDFDVLSTVAVLLSPEGMSKDDVKVIVNNISTYYSKSNNSEITIKEFKLMGFTLINSIPCNVGGGL